MTSQIDYTAVFRLLPVPVLLLTPDFVMTDANDAFFRITGRSREELVGRPVLEAFPDDPAEPSSTGTRNFGASLHRALATGKPDVMALQRYDIEVPGRPGVFRERYWCPVNVPVRSGNSDGETTMIIHVVEEVSDLIRKFVEAQAAGA